MNNLQANTIIEHLHTVISNMLCISQIDMSEIVTQEMIDDFCLVLPGLFAQPIT